jgi:DNA processing protein
VSACPPEAYAAALAGLAPMTVQRLRALLLHHTPAAAWAVVAGEQRPVGLMAEVLAHPVRRQAFRDAVARTDPAAVWAQCVAERVEVVVHGCEGYPALLLDDPVPPPVLFAKGRLELLEGRRVAVVGTRNATAAGRSLARDLGAGLGAAGVHVVSGLARGVDGWVHRGLRSADGAGRPIGVVASGHDVVYPKEHADLWSWVGVDGLLLSEVPPGTPPAPYRFPLRNRIVAALAEVVVVVESRERGGSLITATAALDRGVPIMAVPGSPASRAAAGTNELLRDGAAPVLDVGDVLAALQLDHRLAGGRPIDPRRAVGAAERPVYEVLRGQPRTVEGLALATGLSLVEVALRVARLEVDGWVVQSDGWFEALPPIGGGSPT